MFQSLGHLRDGAPAFILETLKVQGELIILADSQCQYIVCCLLLTESNFNITMFFFIFHRKFTFKKKIVLLLFGAWWL